MNKHVNTVHHATHYDCHACGSRFYNTETINLHLNKKHRVELEGVSKAREMYSITKSRADAWYRIGGDDDPQTQSEAATQMADQQRAPAIDLTTPATTLRRHPTTAALGVMPQETEQTESRASE